MKIILCGSISETKSICKVRDELVSMGHEVEIPKGCKHVYYQNRIEVTQEEKAKDKIEGDLIRGYFEKMKKYDAALIVNVEKKGIEGYIGGNTFLEMGFAHVLGLKLFCLHPINGKQSYASEMLAMQPVILNGRISKLS